MNTKVIEHPKNELYSYINSNSNHETKPAENFLLDFLKLIKNSETQSSRLSSSNLKPLIPFKNLQIKLHGIVFDDKRGSYAIISTGGGVQEIYEERALIFNKTIVEKITKNEVIINYYDESYRLELESQQNKSSSVSWNFVDEEIQQNIIHENSILEQDKRRNPIRLLMIRRPFAVYDSGQFLGYKIMPGGNADQFKRLGFEKGDIITSLNGLIFDGPGMQHFIITELTHALHINLVVLRGQDLVSIIYGF